MKRLVWKDNPKKIIDRSSGILVLLLILWISYASKSDFRCADIGKDHCDENLYVQVEGDTPSPGVYSICGNIDLKKILDKGVDLCIQDGPLSDVPKMVTRSGMKMTIIREGEKRRIHYSEMSGFFKYTLGIPISINNESEEGLTAIPGIGPQTAGAIVRERTKRGRFQSLEELESIKGIGKGSLKRMDRYVCF
jgi:competence protein ComEA